MSWPSPVITTRAFAANVITLEDPADPDAIETLSRRVGHATTGGRRPVVIDLGAVSYIGNHTLSELCPALRQLSGRGARLAILGADPRVRWVLEACQIDGLELHQTIGAALARRRRDRAKPADDSRRAIRREPTQRPETPDTGLPL